jgi:hypothetical protein
MGTTTNGNWLNQYVAPQLLKEFKNYNADFIGALKGAPRSAITADGIRFNKLINNVGFYVNNTAGFTAKKMSGEKVFVEWEKYDTDPTEVDDAEVRYLAYDKRAEVRVKHAEAFQMGIRDHIIWKLAPDDDTNADMPVVRTTGEGAGNRKRLTFVDMVNYLERVKKLNLANENELYIVLCPEHSTDLIVDKNSAKFFADKKIFFNQETGKVNSIMGFKFYENNAAVIYAEDGTKMAKGAVMEDTDRVASLFFYAPNTVYHIERTKILYTPETLDTKSADPKSVFRTQTYGLVDRVVDYGFGALISGIVDIDQ